MSITLDLPDNIEEAVPDAKRAVLVGIAVEGYRTDKLSLGQVGRLMGASRWEAEQILGKNGCHLEMSTEEIMRDVMVMERLLDKEG